MFNDTIKKSLLASVIGMTSIGMTSINVLAETTDQQAELWKALKTQQNTIDQLSTKLKETEKKVEATADAISTPTGSSTSKTSIGGYGEMHLNQWSNHLAGGDDKKEIDFHRFVLFVGHEFSDSVRLYSEFELEHSIASAEDKGEVELEQAYIQWDFADKHSLKVGSFLVPIGIINETHEPNTFYGVERNSVENNIIPSTWWEGGVDFSGELAPGLAYDFAVHSGMSLSPDFADNEFKVRNGRQEVSEAQAEDYAYTTRIKYTGIAGLELAASLQYQTDMWQNAGPSTLDGTLLETHAVYQHGIFSIRALYALWNIDKAIDQIAAGADEQSGGYVEPALRINDQWGVFARYSFWDNQASDNADSEYTETSLGGNYWLTPTTVFKFDVFQQSSPNGQNEYDGFNLGVGYSF